MRSSTDSSPDLALHKYSESSLLAAATRVAFTQKKALALWQLPGSNRKHLIIDLSDELYQGKIDLEESSAGFLFSPYNNNDGSRSLFIKAHVHLTVGPEEASLTQDPSHVQEEFMNSLKKELDTSQNKPLVFQGSAHDGQMRPTAESYQQIIEKALNAISRGTFLKVVPAIYQEIDLPADFNCLQLFDQLCNSYPEAFKSLVSIPGVGSWMGASPEPIIEVNRTKTFSTAALAGTQAFDPEVPLSEVAWRQKEIEEQALVSRYIINCFKKIRLREFEEVGPRTVVAGNLLHLKSTYTVDMKATNFPQLGTVMLDLLHPTSAVCGMPQAPAQEFLESHENFNRAFFSGYLGPVNVESETHCFVNLRCMQLHTQSATLYAGAGVTADSNPQKEWMETQLKFNTLLAVLKAVT